MKNANYLKEIFKLIKRSFIDFFVMKWFTNSNKMEFPVCKCQLLWFMLIFNFHKNIERIEMFRFMKI